MELSSRKIWGDHQTLCTSRHAWFHVTFSSIFTMINLIFGDPKLKPLLFSQPVKEFGKWGRGESWFMIISKQMPWQYAWLYEIIPNSIQQSILYVEIEMPTIRLHTLVFTLSHERNCGKLWNHSMIICPHIVGTRHDPHSNVDMLRLRCTSITSFVIKQGHNQTKWIWHGSILIAKWLRSWTFSTIISSNQNTFSIPRPTCEL